VTESFKDTDRRKTYIGLEIDSRPKVANIHIMLRERNGAEFIREKRKERAEPVGEINVKKI